MLGNAIITGASQGIGKAIACRLSRDGFRVAINDLPSQKAQLEEVHAYITEQGGTSTIILGDVSIESEVKEMVDTAVERFGGLDVMVANAGICKPASFLDTTVEDLHHTLSVNALGTFLCYKYAAHQMIEQGRGGRIIGACSVAGKTGSPLLGAYCASKFAVRGLTQTAALEFGKYGITVNAYAPGIIDTTMARNLIEFRKQQGLDTKGPLVGFNGEPDDIAGLVSYLASKESRFITGQSISINGGFFFD